MLGKFLGIINTPRKWLHALLGLGRPHPPREVAFGLLLGWLIGFGPWGLHTAVPLMLLVLMRCFWPMAVVGCVGGMAIWPIAAGYTEELGHSLLSAKGFVAGWVQWASEAPVLAWMDLQEYRMVGAMALGIAIGGTASIALRVILGILYRFGIGRIGPWVFAKVAGATGAGPDEDQAMRDTLWTKGPFRIVRPIGLIAVPVLALLFAWGGSATAGHALKHQIATQLSAHLGTKVTIGSLDLSFADATLEIAELAVWDPKHPESAILKAESMRLDLSAGALLAGRVHATEAVIRGLDLQVTRRPSGALNLDDLTPFAGDNSAGGTSSAKGLLDWAASKALRSADLDWADLVQRLRPYLEQRPATAQSPAQAAAAEFPPPGDGARWNVPRSKPAWLIERAALDACRIRFAGDKAPVVVETVSGEVRQWSSDRALHGQPVGFKIAGTMAGTPVALTGALEPPARGGGLTLSWK